jgi:hypothetical protein
VGVLVTGDGDASAGVAEPQGSQRHVGHLLVVITAAGRRERAQKQLQTYQ